MVVTKPRGLVTTAWNAVAGYAVVVVRLPSSECCTTEVTRPMPSYVVVTPAVAPLAVLG